MLVVKASAFGTMTVSEGTLQIACEAIADTIWCQMTVNNAFAPALMLGCSEFTQRELVEHAGV